MKTKFIFFVLALLATGCSKPLVAIPFDKPDTKSINFSIAEPMTLSFWTSLNTEYDGAIDLSYNITLALDGTPLPNTVCHAFNVDMRINSMTTSFNDHHSVKYLGRMKCNVSIPGPGDIRGQVSFAIAPDNASVKILSADLQIK